MRTLAALVAVAAVLGCQLPSWQQQPTTNKARKDVLVQFTESSLHPEIAKVLAGGNVAWVNYSEGFDGAVVFPASIRESFTCSKLRPIFFEVAAGYQSMPITENGENVALPCPLKPGEYSYQLNLFTAGTLYGFGGGAGASMENPQFTMSGKIIVE